MLGVDIVVLREYTQISFNYYVFNMTPNKYPSSTRNPQHRPSGPYRQRPEGYVNPRSFYGTGAFKWAVYPDYWKPGWGDKPLLGHVYADSEFYAKREAYNRGLLTQNYTIEPDVVKIGVAYRKDA